MDGQTNKSKTVYPLLLQSRCMKMTIIVGHLEKDCIMCSNRSLGIRREAECFVRVVEGGFTSTAKNSINALNRENILVGRPNCIGCSVFLSVTVK